MKPDEHIWLYGYTYNPRSLVAADPDWLTPNVSRLSNINKIKTNINNVLF